jgi:hypothetical protein
VSPAGCKPSLAQPSSVTAPPELVKELPLATTAMGNE